MQVCGFLVNNEGASLKRIENGAFNLFSHLMHALLLQIDTDGGIMNKANVCLLINTPTKPKLTLRRDPSKHYKFYPN